MKKLLLKKALKGFTLIELIIVIVILGVLIAAAIPKYKDLQFDSQQSATFGSLASLRSATSIWIAKNSTHAPPKIVADGNDGSTPCTECNGGTDPDDGTLDVDFFPAYVQKIPSNDLLDDFGGATADAAKIKAITLTSSHPLALSTGAWLGSSGCGTSRASSGEVDETSGWLFGAVPSGSLGAGGQGFDWRININDCVGSSSQGYYDK